MKKLVVMVVVGAVLFAAHCVESEPGWSDLTGNFTGTREFTFMACLEGTDILYAGTARGLYSTRGLREKWYRERLPASGPVVSGIAISSKEVFVSSEEGLFSKRGENGQWRHIGGKTGLRGVCLYSEGVLAWTDERVYEVTENAWLDITPRMGAGRITAAAAESGIVYLSRGGDIIYGKPRDEDWNMVTLVFGAPDEEDEVGNTAGEEESMVFAQIRDIVPSETGGVTVSTGSGIFLVDGRSGSVSRVDTRGLPAAEVVTAIGIREGVLAASYGKVFLRRHDGNFWIPVIETGGRESIRQIISSIWTDGKRRMYVMSRRGIYTAPAGEIISPERVRYEQGRRKGALSAGPDVREVHRMAIDYAEVSPQKIRSWRQAARWRGILPRFVFRYDENYSDKVEIYKSATQRYLVKGPRTKRDSWSATFTWDLADLIWNPSQTSIDVRSRLMVQLRDNILEDVTRLYFERKRLVSRVMDHRESETGKVAENYDRIEELTAYLDAYTGGMFSRALDTGGDM